MPRPKHLYYDVEYNKQRMLDPGSWPLWPILPVKHLRRRDPLLGNMVPTTGILYAYEIQVGQYIVHVGTLGLTDWNTAPTETFASIDALLADGWIGD